MKARKLTPEQIEDLFAFCEEQDVPYYDVQIELVDHLANAIEQKWIENPVLTYDEALWQVFENFGVSGFRKIRREKERVLQRKYGKLRTRYIAEFFKLPKIILTISLAIIIFLVFHRYGLGSDVTTLILATYLVPFVIFIAYIIKRENRFILNSDKQFLLISKLNELRIGLLPIFVIPFWWIYWFKIVGKSFEQEGFNSPTLMFFEMALALFIVLSSAALIVNYVYMPRKIKTDFAQEFPQFVKA